MTPFEELLAAIRLKNSWGKNELIQLIALILAKHTKGVNYETPSHLY
jgi:hypothetical protein